MQTKSFDMPALFADHHVVEVRRILLELPGVTEVYASSAFQVVEVTYDENTINDLQIALALDEAGYLDEWTVPVELAREAQPGASGAGAFYRHSVVYETAKKTVTFAQRVNYQGRPLWHCPGLGTIKLEEEDKHA